jgi:hypothetical protein
MGKEAICRYQADWYLGLGKLVALTRLPELIWFMQSYGGFLTSKVIEADSGVISLGST